MGFLNNVWKTLQGYGNEANDALADAQGIRIMEQEIRDAKDNQRKANESLTDVMAEQKNMARKVKDLQASVDEYGNAIAKLLEQGNEGLAMETAEKLAEIETDLDANQAVLEGYNSQVSELKAIVKESSKQIEALSREVSIVKSTEAAQKAQEATAAQFSGTNSSLRSASASMERIKAKQQKRKDKMQAARELAKETSGTELKDKLAQAGVIGSKNSAASILERYKK
ncbi:MAG: PspA/IM30 family protein [Gammaproteobacteria bacterium]|nr:PspA/IM30 family protein [Gammaproteobacteria bacterium]